MTVVYPMRSKILIVNENSEEADLLRIILEDENHILDIAASGECALDIAGKSMPDLILLGSTFPDMDGIEVQRRLKKEASTQGIPVILLAGKNEMENIVKSFPAVGVDCLTKPFLGEEVLARTRSHLHFKSLVNQYAEESEALKKRNAELEKEIADKNRAVTVAEIQNRALEAFAQDNSLSDIIDILTKGLESQFDGCMCSVLVFNPESQSLHHCSAPSLPAKFSQAIEGMQIGPSVGSCGTAAYTKKLVVVEDIETDPLWKRAQKFALSHNLRACWSLPILAADDRVLGTFAVYYSSPRRPSKEELDLIGSFAYVAGVTIESKELEKSSRAKSDFLARMSHELRTPMNSILGFTQLLEMDVQNPLTSYQKDNLRTISSAGQHLLELINEVLDLSKIETGHLELSIEVINLNELVDNVVSFSKPLAENKGVTLKLQNSQSQEYFAETDSLRLKEVLLNLLSNAIKYNKLNGSVTVSFEEQAEGKIRIGVRDTGHGISAENKLKVFKPFERFDVDSDFIEGTGIGLSISKRLVEMMNGSINFESELREGSFFYIDLPISDKTPTLPHIKEKLNMPNVSTEKRGNCKIVYIEDILENIELVRQILSHRKDIELFYATNALDGIELARAEMPDLILMDIHLPEIDGLTAFKRLQAIDEMRSIPVVALTSDAMDTNAKKALEMGFHSYITKPIDIPKFMSLIKSILF